MPKEATSTSRRFGWLRPIARFSRHSDQRGRVRRRGAQVVEFALVVPIFILLVFGMIEFGRMVMVQQILTNGSREGARQAVLENATTADVQQAVSEYLANSSITNATVLVSPDPPGDAGFGEPVTVTVSIAFADVSWIPSPLYLQGTTLSASTVMRRESVQ